MNRNVVGLDIAKQVFHLFTMQDGKAVKKKLKLSELSAFVAQLPVCLIAMEACGGAHHWARQFQSSNGLLFAVQMSGNGGVVVQTCWFFIAIHWTCCTGPGYSAK